MSPSKVVDAPGPIGIASMGARHQRLLAYVVHAPGSTPSTPTKPLISSYSMLSHRLCAHLAPYQATSAFVHHQ
jgi:hypothetical protein